MRRSKIAHMPMGSFFLQQLEFSLQFNPIGLDDAELGLFSSIMIMNAGECRPAPACRPAPIRPAPFNPTRPVSIMYHIQST